MNIYEIEIDGIPGFFVAPHLAKLDQSFKNTESYNQGLCEASIYEKKVKKERPSRDLNPSRSLEMAYLGVLTDSRLSYADYNSNGNHIHQVVAEAQLHCLVHPIAIH